MEEEAGGEDFTGGGAAGLKAGGLGADGRSPAGLKAGEGAWCCGMAGAKRCPGVEKGFTFGCGARPWSRLGCQALGVGMRGASTFGRGEKMFFPVPGLGAFGWKRPSPAAGGNGVLGE